MLDPLIVVSCVPFLLHRRKRTRAGVWMCDQLSNCRATVGPDPPDADRAFPTTSINTSGVMGFRSVRKTRDGTSHSVAVTTTMGIA